MSIRGFILVLLCLWYSIGSYTIEAQPYEQGKWRILPIEYKDPHFQITKNDVPGMIRGTKTKCNMAPRDPFGYTSIKGNCFFPGGNKEIHGISLEDVNQCYWVRALTVHNCNMLYKAMAIDLTPISPISNDNRLQKIDFTIVKRVLWNYWAACDGNKKLEERTFTETRDYTNAYQPSLSPTIMATSNRPMIEKDGISTVAASIDGNEIFKLYAQYDFGDDMRYYTWEYNLYSGDANSDTWKPLNRTGKCITGTMAQLMYPVENVQNYSYKTIYFRFKKTAILFNQNKSIYDDNLASSIVYHPKPIEIEIKDSRVTCKGDTNARFSVTLKEDLPKDFCLRFEIAANYGPGTIANVKIKANTTIPAGSFFPFNLDSAKLPAGTYIIKYNQYSVDSNKTSSLETRTFVIAEPDSVNFPRRIFADDYLLCAGTTGQTFINTKEAWRSGNGAPYHFWLYKEGAIDTVKKDFTNNNATYTFDGLKSGKYTYGGTDWLGCPASVNSFELKEPAIPSYRIKTEDSLGEYKTGVARCYGLDDSIKNMYVYNPRATVAYYEMNTTQPDRAGEWWSTYYKHANLGNPNQDTFVNPVFNLNGKLRDTTIVQLREWHIDKESGLSFTCPVYKRDRRDSLILKDSTRLIVDTVLFINEGVDIVGDTALKLKKDSSYFTIDTILYADSGLYISNKKDSLYWDRDSVLYKNDSMYIVKDTVFLNLYKTWTLSDSVFKVQDTLFVNRTNLLYTGDSIYIQ